ncbi:MAG: sensor domain-containing diguanylate cyclase [Cyanobium sp.]
MPTMGVFLLCGFGASSAFSYFSARGILDRQLVTTTLPLTAQALSGEVERYLTRPVLLSSSMARNTFLERWIAAGERDQSQMVNYLRDIQAKYGATTAFFVSGRTGRYYHPKGVLKSVSPSDPGDRWFYRVQASADPFEVNIDRDTADPNRVTAFSNFRVLDQAGGFIGAIGLGIDVRELARELNRFQDRYGARVLLVTRAGEVVLSPGDGSEGDSVATLKEVPGLAPYVSRILDQPATSLQFSQGEGQLFVSSRQIPELGWVMVVLQQTDPSKQGLLPILGQNLLIALAVSSVVLLLANATVGNYQRRLQQLAITDKLTGLLNRTAFDTLFDRLVKDSLRRQEPLAVMLFDIDFFKLVNDSHGHAVGDQVIQHVAAVLQRSTRGSDLLFRWGGEEFLLLLPDCSASQAQERAGRQRQILRSEPLPNSPSSADPITTPTLSCGVTTYQLGETRLELLLRADQALYAAKRGGRDRVVCLDVEAPLLGRID